MIALLALLCAISASCGKKGPPLTPFVFIPAEAPVSAPRRVGDEVYLTVTVPAQNIDASKPASISRIEVYAATSLTPPTRARFLEIARHVATIPVAPVAAPGEAPPPPPPAGVSAGASQGARITIRDSLTPDDLVARELAPLPGARQIPGLAPPLTPLVLRRFYIAIPFSLRDVAGPPSAIIEMPLLPLPEPPLDVRASYTDRAITVAWDPPGGLLGWLLDNVTRAEERPPLDNLPRVAARPTPPGAVLPPGPTLYSVYKRRAPDPLVLPDPNAEAAAWNVAAPVAVTPTPITALSFSEPVELDERRLCYTVHSVRGNVEGGPSEPACVTPIDIYPPAAPTGVGVIAAEGEITIFWDSNSEPDLGGYLVLRREAGSDRLLPLTETPITEPRFADRTVTAGVQYFYSVVAVDTRLPLPNMSPPSAEESDTAR